MKKENCNELLEALEVVNKAFIELEPIPASFYKSIGDSEIALENKDEIYKNIRRILMNVINDPTIHITIIESIYKTLCNSKLKSECISMTDKDPNL